jgi:glycosyltransferase involved in cell wall biosynthesis
LQISHLSFSNSGGAGRVAQILSDEQRVLGHEVDFQYLTKTNLFLSPLENPVITLAAAADHFLLKKKGFDAPISLLRSKVQSFDSLGASEVIHLHWIQGVLKLSSISQMPKLTDHLFLTLHDLRASTATCHHPLSCVGYKTGCFGCPAVISPLADSVHKIGIAQKNSFLKSGVKLIAPSRWAAGIAQDSFITRDLETRIIENPIDPIFFRDLPQRKLRVGPLRLGLIAANLLDPIKGVLPFVNELLKNMNKSNELEIRLIGSRGESLEKLNPRIKWLGQIEKQQLIYEIDDLDALVIPSLAETAGMVIAEASARSVPSLGLSGSGTSDMISHGKNGLLFGSLREMTKFLLSENASQVLDRYLDSSIRESSRWNPTLSAKKHLEFYQERSS